jgi:alanine racemase
MSTVSAESRALFARPNVFTVDLGAVRRCAQAIRSQAPAPVVFFATLKSDAYGFGLLPVARTVISAGADGLSLINLTDAIALREAGFACPILLYAGVPLTPEAVEVIERYRLMPTLHNEASLEQLRLAARGPLDCAIKIDAGQERIGVPAESAAAFLQSVAATPNLRIALVNTHPYLTGAPDAADSLSWQFARFDAACQAAVAYGVHIPMRVIASSKVLRLTASLKLEGIDPGQALFSSISPETADCQPFHSLTTRLLQVRAVTRNEHLEFSPFGARRPTRLGVVPFGYSDGAHRLHAGEVLVAGRRVPILGQPSLEYTRLDLSAVPESEVGDEVVFIGRQGDEQIAPAQVLEAQKIAKVSDLALEVRATVVRKYVNG